MYYDDKTCVVCGDKFTTIEEHNKHYKECSDRNFKTDYTEEEFFEIIHYEDAF
ncbi:hypothetical protein [Neobacillus sp.]|uniref:hypothetical protein n=1 Tax=Neobacillus sp. TaxID=2675273 RepID=UPI0035B50691